MISSGRYSYEDALVIENAVRERYTHEQVPVIHVADLKVPRLLHGVAKKDVEKAYKTQSQLMSQRVQALGAQPPADLADVHIVLLDWKSQVSTEYNTGDVQKTAVAVLIDNQGAVRGYFTGPQAKDQLMAQFG
jgi:hypothetical protein